MKVLKDSDIPWIGEIPSDWEIKKVKYLAKRLSKGNGITKEEIFPDGDIPCVRYGEIYTRYNNSFTKCVSATRSEIHSSPQFFSTGDILMAGTGELVEEIGKGVVYLGEERCMAGGDIIILTPNHNSVFLNFALNSSYAQAQRSQNKAKLKVVHISPSEIGSILIAIPSFEEQQSIASLLDTKYREIDAIQDKTQASIEEYKKLRQSIITEAVTKGIRRNRPMKVTDSVWFSEIPSTWGFKRLKYLFRIEKRIAGEIGHTVLAITQKGVVPKKMDSGDRGQFAEDYSNYQLVYPGDFAMNHMDLLTGWVDISRYAGVTSPDYRVFTLIDQATNHPAYYLYFMQMCYMDKIFYGMGAGVSGMGRWRLQADKFLNFFIPIPPYAEQQEIAAYLDEKCATIDSLIASKEALITELEAYKKSIIYEYVTGKKEAL